MNGKLLQRAESIAQREELELYIESNEYEEFQVYENMKHFFEQENSVSTEKNAVYNELNHQKELLEQVTKEIHEKSDELHDANYNLQRIAYEKPLKLKRIGEENTILEEKLEEMAETLRIPNVNSLFEILSKRNGYFLECTVLARQLELISQEEANLKELVMKEYNERIKEIDNLKKTKGNHEAKILELTKKNEELLKKKRERLSDIEEWKKSVRQYFQSRNSEKKEGDLKQLYSYENFEKLMDEQVQDLEINPEKYEEFKDELFHYFECLEIQEKDCFYFFNLCC